MEAGLSVAEQKLYSNAEDGRPTIFDTDNMDKSDDSGTIRAHIIRSLLLKLDRAKASSGLDIRGALLTESLDLTGITVSTALLLTDCRFTEAVDLSDAEIPRLVLRGCRLPGLRADGLTVTKGLNAQNACYEGPVYLRSASIGGELNLVGARLTGNGGPALIADGLQVNGDLLMSDGFVAEGARDGVIRLLGARIAGNLSCDEAHIHNPQGPALQAERANVDGNILLRASGCTGTVVLLGASVQGRFTCEGSRLIGRGGPALMADGMRVDGDVVLNGLHAISYGTEAVVCMPGAQIGGSLLCESGQVSAAGKGGALDLMFTKLSRRLALHPGFAARGDVHLDGLDYPAVPRGMDRNEWTHLLRDHTVYATQPYQQLAAAYRAAGRDEDARAMLIAQQDHLRRSADIPRRTRARLALLKLTLGYGYQSWRAAVGLLITAVCAVTFVFTADRVTPAVKSPATGRSCKVIERVGLGVELAVPLVKVAGRSRCDLIPVQDDAEDAAAVAGGWVFQALGWAFATLLVAGYSGLIRTD
jgi:hypothetical protein